MRLPPALMARAVSGVGRRFSPKRAARTVLLPALAGLALVVALTLGLRNLTGDPSVASPSLPILLGSGPAVVFSELGETADTLWAADPDDPTERIALGRVAHERWYGIFPSLAPNGAFVAYTVLPPGGAGAELWVLEIAGGEARRLARDIELRITPVWSAEADAIVVRGSAGPSGGQLLRVDLGGSVTPLVAAEAQLFPPEAQLFPIDFSADGWFYYAALTSSGTSLARVPALGGEAALVANLSDGFARDWRLSPDGTRLAYLAQTSQDAGAAFVAQVLDLSTGLVQTPLASADVAQFSPVWEREGALTIGRLDAAGGAPVRLSRDGGLSATSAVPASARPSGFDVPLSWSPDGGHLAVRSFAGASVADPGPSSVVVVSTDGARRALSSRSDVAIAGWLEAAP